MAPAMGEVVLPLVPMYHCMVMGVDVLDGAIVSGADLPCTMVLLADCESMEMAGQPLTVTVTVCESAGGEQALLTRTQSVVVKAGVIELLLTFPPASGCAVLPLLPVYHWYCSGASPLAVTEREADPPLLIDADDGCVVMDGGVQ